MTEIVVITCSFYIVCSYLGLIRFKRSIQLLEKVTYSFNGLTVKKISIVWKIELVVVKIV